MLNIHNCRRAFLILLVGIFLTLTVIQLTHNSRVKYTIEKDKSSLPILKVIKEIKFEYPQVLFNPGLVVDPQNPNHYIMPLRQEIDGSGKRVRDNNIWIANINSDFEVTGLNKITSTVARRAQDAVAFNYKDDIYLAYNGVNTEFTKVERNIGKKEVLMFVSKIILEESNPHFEESYAMPNPMHHTIHQKNWSPFVSNGKINFIYSINPHIVYEWNDNDTKIETEYNSSAGVLSPYVWKYGEPHGGTPAIYVKEFDSYISFFQSHIENDPIVDWVSRRRRYYIGAYMFDKNPPYRIKAYVTKPLSYPGMYDDEDDNFFRIVFPRGVVDSGDEYLISAGLDDYRNIIMSVNKNELFNHFTFIN